MCGRKAEKLKGKEKSQSQGQVPDRQDRFAKAGQNLDPLGRTIDYLRISVTDRCNLRCIYCMPEGCSRCEQEPPLSLEELLEIAGTAADFGISHIKVTGGEPLLREDTPELCRRLKAIPGIQTVTLTTNGLLLQKYLPALKEAGIDGINVSLDTLDPERYRQITGGGRLSQVLASIEAALAEEIPTKINAALLDPEAAEDSLALAALAEKRPIAVRFIEMMPIGCGSRFPGCDNRLILKKLLERWPDLKKEKAALGYGPAVYYTSDRLTGWIGFISAIHGTFCQSCRRLRLSCHGRLTPCLCYGEGIELRPLLRQEGKEALYQAFCEAVKRKPEGHCFSQQEKISEKRMMSQIGG